MAEPNGDHQESTEQAGVFKISENKEEKLEINDSDGKEYDPFEHKNAKHPTTYCETWVHMFKGTVGTGVLSLPIAFSQSGYVIGVIGVLFMTYLATYCAYVLAKSEVELCKRRNIPSLSYQAAAHAALQDGPLVTRKFAPFALHLCNVFLLLSQIGAACVYIIFIAANIKAITDVYVGVYELRTVLLWSGVPLLGISLIKQLKFLAPFSTLGSFTVLLSCSVLFYHMFSQSGDLAERKAFGDPSQLPHVFGTFFFATGCISLVLPLQNEMQNPRKFTSALGVLNTGNFTVALLYATFGFFGYLTYGDLVADSVTLNLPPSHLSSQVVQVMLSVATLVSTALCYYVAVIIINENYLPRSFDKLISEYVIRVSLVIITVVIALLIPNLELFVSLTGVLSSCILNTVLPCLIHLFTFVNRVDSKFQYFLFAQDIFSILLTGVIFVTGMSSNISKVIEMYE